MRADVTGLLTGFAKAETGLAGLSTKVLMAGSLVAVAIGGLSVKAFADFDAEMTKSLAIMGDVSASLRDDMAEEARKMARTTSVSAKDAAESYFFLASAGLSAADSLGALEAVTTFAVAGQFDMAKATDLLTDAQSALGKTIKGDAIANMEEMVKISDMLVGANTLANASTEQFASALTSKSAAAMKAYNIPLEEGLGLLAFWADQGLKGERAGSQFGSMLTILTKNSQRNKEAFASLGIELFDTEGNLKSLSEIAREFTQALGWMSDAERAAAFDAAGINRLLVDSVNKMMGGSRAIAGYTRSLQEMGGITQDVADKQLDTFNAQLGLLASNVVDLGIEIGSKLVPPLKLLVETLVVSSQFLNDHKEILVGIGVVITVILIPALIAWTARTWAQVTANLSLSASTGAGIAIAIASAAAIALIIKQTRVWKHEIADIVGATEEEVDALKDLIVTQQWGEKRAREAVALAKVEREIAERKYEGLTKTTDATINAGGATDDYVEKIKNAAYERDIAIYIEEKYIQVLEDTIAIELKLADAARTRSEAQRLAEISYKELQLRATSAAASVGIDIEVWSMNRAELEKIISAYETYNAARRLEETGYYETIDTLALLTSELRETGIGVDDLAASVKSLADRARDAAEDFRQGRLAETIETFMRDGMEGVGKLNKEFKRLDETWERTILPGIKHLGATVVEEWQAMWDRVGRDMEGGRRMVEDGLGGILGILIARRLAEGSLSVSEGVAPGIGAGRGFDAGAKIRIDHQEINIGPGASLTVAEVQTGMADGMRSSLAGQAAGG